MVSNITEATAFFTHQLLHRWKILLRSVKDDE